MAYFPLVLARKKLVLLVFFRPCISIDGAIERRWISTYIALDFVQNDVKHLSKI